MRRRFHSVGTLPADVRVRRVLRWCAVIGLPLLAGSAVAIVAVGAARQWADLPTASAVFGRQLVIAFLVQSLIVAGCIGVFGLVATVFVVIMHREQGVFEEWIVEIDGDAMTAAHGSHRWRIAWADVTHLDRSVFSRVVTIRRGTGPSVTLPLTLTPTDASERVSRWRLAFGRTSAAPLARALFEGREALVRRRMTLGDGAMMVFALIAVATFVTIGARLHRAQGVGVDEAFALALAPSTVDADRARAIAETRPNLGFGRLGLALALRSEGRLAEALGEAERAVALDPWLDSAHEWRATILLELGRTREAVLARDPRQPRGNLGLARDLLLLGRVDDARRWAESSPAGPEPARADATLALVELADGRLAAARAASPSGRQRDPHEILALVCEGREAEAWARLDSWDADGLLTKLTAQAISGTARLPVEMAPDIISPWTVRWLAEARAILRSCRERRRIDS